ncbi:MAG: outer membrane beta-barrel family protein [Bacteroidota bacterium]
MKNIVLLSLFCLSTLASVFAQNTLNGRVTGDQKEGIFFATVALFQQTDSSLHRSISTDDAGYFKIENIKEGIYYLQVNRLGYSTQTIRDLSFPKANGKDLAVRLSEDAQLLSTVEVTAKQPLLEQQSDRLVVNVENNMTNLNNSLLDVMKQVPGMIVAGDKLKMAGQRNLTILINGKTTRYMDVQSLLKDMPGDNVKKIEVIHQPGAEFDAEGTGPIINVILKKNSLFGTNGSVSLGLAKGYDWKYRSGIAMSHYQGKVNINGSVGYRNSPWYDEMRITRRVGEDVYEQISKDPGDSESFRADFSMDWDVTERQRLGMSTRFLENWSDYQISNQTNIDFASNELDDLRLRTQTTRDNTWNMLTFNPYYAFEIDTMGQHLDVDLNLVRIENEGFTLLETEELNFQEPFLGQQYQQPGETDIFALKLDYSYPFSKALKAKVGAKYSDASLDNDLVALDETSSGEWVNNTLQSNHFIFDERIKAAYAKLKFQAGKWNGTAGLRFEESNSKGYSVTLDSTINRDFSQLFPSFSLGREITPELGATLAYSYRIDRPRYHNLNPFVYYLDPYTFERGNPSLIPSLTHSLKFTLAYEKQPFFNIEYKKTNDAMVDVTEQNDETGETNLTTVNLESFNVFNASLFFPLSFIPHVDGYGGFIANHGAYDSEYLDQQFSRSKWDFTAFVQTDFTLPGEINAEVTAWYNSGGQDGILNASWLYGVDVGFGKKFLDNKLQVNFGVENLFARYLHADIRYANMDVDLYDRWDGPVVSMQFKYKFGNQHMKRQKKHRSGASDEINRAQQD